MYPELTQFNNWLKGQYPTSSAGVRYSSDLALFFSFAGNSPAKITPSDMDRYISDCLEQGHRPATINRRLSALYTFYYFLYDFRSAACLPGIAQTQASKVVSSSPRW